MSLPAIGEVWRIYAPTAGKAKYQLCVKVGVARGAHRFVFLSSENRYAGGYAVPCARVPFLPVSRTGQTVFGFALVLAYSDAQLGLFQARREGAIDRALAAELLAFARTVKTLAGEDKRLVVAALESLV